MDLFLFDDLHESPRDPSVSVTTPEVSPNAEKNRGSEIRRKQLVVLSVISALFAIVFLSFLFLSPAQSSRIYPVYISEILASNISHPNTDGRCCDFIELYNSADYPIDLSGFQLGDVAGNNRYSFPSGTIIQPDSYLVVYCDKTVDDASYAKFGISRGGGEDIYLIGNNRAVLDKVTTIPTDMDESMVLSDGQWIVSSTVTPGRSSQDKQTSQVLHNSSVSPVRITELSSAETGYCEELQLHCDWIELYNPSTETIDISGFCLTDNIGIDKYCFPQGTLIQPNQYLIVFCSNDISSNELAPFGLSQAGGESVVLKDHNGMIVQIVDCLALDIGQSMVLTDDLWTVTQACSPGYENSEKGHHDYLSAIGLDAKNIVISEVMSSTQLHLADYQGDFPDWIELYNKSAASISLSGWYLSDDPNDPCKWQFPHLVLAPGERVVIFCSGKDTVQNGEIHTSFSLSSSGESLMLSSHLGSIADAVTFGSSEQYHSYIFEADGTAITATPTPGYPNDDSGYEAFSTSRTASSPLAIWEAMTSNDTYLPQALGVCYDWVELRNTSDVEIMLSDYAITDDPDVPLQYILPEEELSPGESIVIILSGDESLSNKNYNHAGFSLNAAEDQLLLYKTDGSLVDYVYLQDIPLTYSYGRYDAASGFLYMEPTPGKENTAGIRSVSAMVTSSMPAGVYTDSDRYLITLSAPGEIYYTTDGSEPNIDSAKYESPIEIADTTVLRAAAVEDGKLRSKIFTATFIIDSPHSLPVVSLVTDPDNLWGKDGIYKNGNIDIKEEKRSANVSYSGSDGSFSLDCELSLQGNTSVVKHDKKSFKLRFQNSYDGPLQYDVFEDGEVTVFESLALRTAYEDTYSTQMRDNLLHDIASQCSDVLITQKHKYVVVYLNGEYWGLYAIREAHTESHYASYRNVPAETVSVIKNFILPGTGLYSTFLLCEDQSFKSDADYAYAKSILDVESFADWIIFQSYSSNVDVTSNVRYYYSSSDSLWRCGLVDLDCGLLYGAFGFKGIAECFHHGVIISALMENEEFQDLLARRLASYLSGPLSDESMLSAIDEMAASIRDEIPRERARWGGTVTQWEDMVSRLKKYCDGQALRSIDSLCSYLNFSEEERNFYFSEVLALHGSS